MKLKSEYLIISIFTFFIYKTVTIFQKVYYILLKNDPS